MIRMRTIEIVKCMNYENLEYRNMLRMLQTASTAIANKAQAMILKADGDIYSKIIANKDGYPSFQNIEGSKKFDIPKYDHKISNTINTELREQNPFAYLHSGATSAIIKTVQDKYFGERLNIVLGKRSSPTYRNFPIPVRDWSIKIDADGGFVVKASVLSKDSPPDFLKGKMPVQPEFLLHPKGCGEYRRELMAIMEGTKNKIAKLIYNKTKNKWLFAFPVEITPRQVELYEARTMIVYPPSDENMLRCEYRHDGVKTNRWIQNISFWSPAHLKSNHDALSKSISTHYRQSKVGGFIGHGRKRALRDKMKFQEVYKKRCKTLNQQRAHFIVQCAVRWNCKNISYVSPANWPEEFGRRNLIDSWPWFQLAQFVKNKCDEYGINFNNINAKEQIAQLGILEELNVTQNA